MLHARYKRGDTERGSGCKENFIMFFLNFASFLRKHEFSIAPGSIIDFFRLFPQYDIFQYEEMLITLRSLFAKSQMEFKNFETLLQKYLFETAENSAYDYMKEHSQEVDALLEKLKEQKFDNIEIRTNTAKEDKSLAQQAEANKEAIEKILNDSNTQDILPILMLNEREIIQMASSSSEARIKNMLNQAMLHNIMQQNHPLFNQLCIKGAKLYSKINAKVKTELSARQSRIDEIEKRSTLHHRKDFLFGSRAVRTVYDIMDKSITNLEQDEYELLAQYIKQNAAKFRTRISRSMKVSKRKTFDFERTIKKSMETFGEPAKLYYKKPQVKKTRVICIADISGSVKQHIKLVLQLLYELSSVFKGGVRSYVFVGDLYEVTEYMTQYPFEQGMILVNQQVTREYSNYDKALEMFVKNHIGVLDKQTIVLMIGDARNNKNNTGIHHLTQIKNKSKSIFWLNPEVKLKWNTGDSIIGKYEPIVNAVYQINTFRELTGFLDDFTHG